MNMGLTSSETKVAVLILEGYSDKEIGELLGLKPRTVSVYACRAAEKLGITGSLRRTIRRQPELEITVKVTKQEAGALLTRLKEAV